jgi:PKD repeat protein
MKITTIIFLLPLLIANSLNSQVLCDGTGNLAIFSNYDGGILTINVDQDIPDLKVGICTYEPIQVNFTGAFVSNVTQVIYAGFNSMQNNNNCGQGNFATSISGVSSSLITIETFPEVGYDNPNGYTYMVGTGGYCSSTQNAGGGNTPDQIVYYFQQNLGGVFRFHVTQYACWQNETLNISSGGNCCVVPNSNNPNPVAAFAANDTEICAGACVTFINLSQNGPFNSINWTFEGGNPSSSTFFSPQVCYPENGVYNVTLNISNSNGSDNTTATGYINVSNNQFTVSLNPAGPVSLCEGETIILVAEPELSNYQWSNGENTQQITVSETGGYSVSAENDLGCVGVSNVVNVNVTPIPVASFNFEQTFPEYFVEFTNTSTGNGNYVWNFPNGISNLENPQYQFQYDNDWPVTLIASNSCGADTLNTFVNVIKTGISKLFLDDGFIFVQNESIYFKTEKFFSKSAQIEVFNIAGQSIFSRVNPIEKEVLYNVELLKFSSGLYFLQIKDQGDLWIRKFIKF